MATNKVEDQRRLPVHPGKTTIPNYVSDARLGADVFCVYALLARHAGQEYPDAEKQMASIIGLSRSGVQDCLRSLEEAAIIRIEPADNGDTYILLPVPNSSP